MFRPPPVGASTSSISTPLITLLLILLLSAPGGEAQGQTPTEQVQSFIQNTSGFTLMGNVESGSLRDDREILFPVQLSPGRGYMVVGFCDSDCTDLDLVLLDPSGVEVTSDILLDAAPLISFTAETSGRYQVKVVMVSCSVEPCGYAVGIMEGSGEGTPGLGGDMDTRMRSFRTEYHTDGFAEAGQMETGALQEGQEIRFPVTLQEGLEYRVVGVCDNDCQDLDLILFDSRGAEVEADRLTDAIPILEFTPPSTGEYRVAASMVTCTIEPCAYQVAFFVRGEGVGPGGTIVSGSVVSDATHRGRLESGDPRLKEGEYFDEYQVEARAGQTIILDLRSDDFDTYLILEGPGDVSERNDDWEGETRHSHLEWVAGTSGTYSIVVTSFSSGATGGYTLRALVVEGS